MYPKVIVLQELTCIYKVKNVPMFKSYISNIYRVVYFTT